MLSVIIPIHNGEKYIPDLVSHLKEVTYKNFEAIFIDNNSTDKSVLVLQEALKDVPFSSKILSEEKQ
ncbi:MAG: glycosyltransferase family 2 protein, partial [Leptospiraceae bacterium]|nr:glycosyltransferase family 2 protein [Leptospiraceae bacterium]